VNTTMEVITTPRKKKQAIKKKLTPKKANNWCCQEVQYSMLLYDAVRKLWTCIHVCVFCVCISGQVLHGWSYVCWIELIMCVGLNLIYVCWICVCWNYMLDWIYLSMLFNLSYIEYMLLKFIICRSRVRDRGGREG
jgi:hypothetical protein